MNKTILSIVMATLCLFLRVSGQTPVAKPPVLPSIKPVKIGQRIPEVVLTKLHNYKSSTMNLADFETKLIIIDFWATWCIPCVAMIPKIDSLQKEFKHDVQFISVSYQTENEITTFMDKLEKQHNVHYAIPYSTDDNLLRFMFPHKSLPHYVWISANGTVKAITGAEEITSANIDKAMDDQPLLLTEKKDFMVPYDYNKPLLVDGNGGDGSQFIYHSILTNYIPGLKANMHLERADSIHVNSLTLTNCPVMWLYKHAFGNGLATFYDEDRILLEMKHPEELIPSVRDAAYRNWLVKPGHGICYDLRLPASISNQFYTVFRQNLVTLFPQYAAKVEKRKMKSLALVRLPGSDRIKTMHAGGEVIGIFDNMGFTLQNTPLSTLIRRLQPFLRKSSSIVLINKTGYKGLVDIKIRADLTSVADMNSALKPYNVQWQEEFIEMDMLVIKDTCVQNQESKKGE